MLFDLSDIFILLVILGLSLLYFLYWNKKISKTSSSAEFEFSPLNKKSILSLLDSKNITDQLVLFYGSQTGTAEDLATRLAKDTSSRLDLSTVICDMEDYDMEELNQWPVDDPNRKYLIGLLMATYGEGEPTDNATDFYSWLMNGGGIGEDEGNQDDFMVEEQTLKNIPYFVFALGNSTYAHFNSIGRRVDKRFQKLGANRICTRGEGDDDKSMEEDFLAWKSIILKSIGNYFEISADKEKALRARPHVPLFNLINVIDAKKETTFHGEYSTSKPRKWSLDESNNVKELTKKSGFDVKNPYYSRILSINSLFKNCWESYSFETNPNIANISSINSSEISIEDSKVKISRNCFHIDLDITDSGMKYKTGDHLGTWPQNDPYEVEKLSMILNLSENDLNGILKLVPNPENTLSANAKMPFPMPCSVRTVLTYYLDLKAIVKQYQTEILAKYAADSNERDRLFELADNRDIYLEVVEKSQKNLRQLLTEFPSVKIPLNVVLGEFLPRVNLRYYSISSSSKEHPSKISITSVVVKYPLLTQSALKHTGSEHVELKKGLTTTYFERIYESQKKKPVDLEKISQVIPSFHIPVCIRTSNFKLPNDLKIPVILIGPGTGVAPMRGFIRERYHESKTGADVGLTWLFYGCRNPEQDFLYEQEFKEIKSEINTLGLKFDFKTTFAFSRQGRDKVYVQHRIAEEQEYLWEIIEKKRGHVYVCGDAKKMANDVSKQLERMAIEVGKMSEVGAKKWIKGLRSKGRYLEDVWS